VGWIGTSTHTVLNNSTNFKVNALSDWDIDRGHHENPLGRIGMSTRDTTHQRHLSSLNYFFSYLISLHKEKKRKEKEKNEKGESVLTEQPPPKHHVEKKHICRWSQVESRSVTGMPNVAFKKDLTHDAPSTPSHDRFYKE
jgi:hypothetical protein